MLSLISLPPSFDDFLLDNQRLIIGEIDKEDKDQGSIIVVVATDALLLPHQLERVAKRVSLGIGVMGMHWFVFVFSYV